MSLVACLGPMQEMGMNFKHPATVTWPQTRSKFKNLACYHGAASTCRGKFFVPFGAGLGISFSQTRASHNKPDGFSTGSATFGDEMVSVASYCFQKNSSANIE